MASNPPPEVENPGDGPAEDEEEATEPAAGDATGGVGAADEGVMDVVESPATILLHAAARSGNVDQIREALAAGADPDGLNQWGYAALHSAALGGFGDAVTALLVEGRAAADAPNSRGSTALHLAASAGHEGVVSLLLAHGADVLLRSGHGSTSLEVAMDAHPDGPCAQLIRAELERQWQEGEELLRDLDQRLRLARDVQTRVEQQLGGRPGGAGKEEEGAGGEDEAKAAPDSPGGEKRRKHKSQIPAYWFTVERIAGRAHALGEQMVNRAAMRHLPKEALDRFSWTGPLTVSMPLPELDPEDEDLALGLEQLQLAFSERRQREGARREPLPFDDPKVRSHNERLMWEETRHSQQEWTEVILKLLAPDATWDWSRVEVRERAVTSPSDVHGAKGMGMIGVFAVAPIVEAPEPAEGEAEDGSPESKVEETSPKSGSRVTQGAGEPSEGGEPPGPALVFRDGEIVGPLGGLLCRRSNYERRYLPEGHTWLLSDPLSYEFNLRVQTGPLKPDPLVIDLVRGSSQNRLRHLADARADPFGVQDLMQAAAAQTANAGLEQSQADAKRAARAPMPRPRSRQGSPITREKPVEVCTTVSKEPFATTANVRLVEILHDGWPYVFCVAIRDIYAGEELAVDRGEPHWAMQRLSLMRVQEMGKVARELLSSVSGLLDKEAEAAAAAAAAQGRQRKPMKRVGM
eukprot:TRINITY_DN7913_c0_g1_i1.p1 TRINITY_DN7913_c0_g1~~TRINITY_DN7913_c0_g1_i1.p1  ORF type:complete len:692 (-),score=159.68 TRINITY_DN7913_c0_g1_i1:79-2154(-)